MTSSKATAYLFASLFSGMALSACNNDDEHNQPQQEQELITTVRLTLVNQVDTAETHQITFRDLDGEGGQNGTILPDTLRLTTDAAYFASLEVLDESDPLNIEDIGAEIEAEAISHQFFYEALQGVGLTINGFDTDANGLPLGQEATITTTAQPSRGSLRISLSHFAETPKNGTTPSGDTDVEVTFPVSVEN